jgi:hypothetical protein
MSQNSRNQSFFLLYLLNDRRIRIRIQSRIRFRIHTSDSWIWIREAQKHVDPVDPDPEHWEIDMLMVYSTFIKIESKMAYSWHCNIRLNFRNSNNCNKKINN